MMSDKSEIMNNISQIADNAICTACGACAGICPSHAVSIITNTAGYLLAHINADVCNNCGKCLKICPSNPENTPYVNVDEIFHGGCLAGYVGYATDPEIRKRSQSGGIVTALLCYLLEQKEIEGAIVNTLNRKTRRPEAIFAQSKDDIINACGSYYAQSSVSKTILENTSENTAAVVLGCQAESLQLIHERFPNVHLPKYTIGLICAGQYSGNMIDSLVTESGCELNSVSGFRFRDKSVGWPGDVHVVADNNDYWLSKNRRHALKKVYELHRCIPCYDQMNIFSDIVCGDPWGISHKQQSEGNTVIIARTEIGKKLLENATRDGVIILENLSTDDIMRGQTVDDRHKTKFYTSKDIFYNNNWMYPYSEKLFGQTAFSSSNKTTLLDITKRLEYSRDLYLTTGEKDYHEKINLQTRILQGNILVRIKRKTFRLGGKVLRLFALIK